MRLFIVIRTRGPAWRDSQPIESQADWTGHASFMNSLAKEGFVILGGPLEGTSDVLLVVRAKTSDEVRSRRAVDPWSGNDLLRIARVAPWTLRLGSLSEQEMMPLQEDAMSGIEKVATLTIAVKDQEEALRWFTEKLEFEKRLDLAAPGMRWLTIAPRKQKEVEFVLASWFPTHVGKNAPCVVETSNCRKTYETLKGRGVKFSQTPTDKPYGVEAVFEDLYGNNYALVERKPIG